MRYYAILLAVALTAPSAAFAQQQKASATMPKPVVSQKVSALALKKLSMVIKAEPKVIRQFYGEVLLMNEQHDPQSRVYRYLPDGGGEGCRLSVPAKNPDTVGLLLALAAACKSSAPTG